jgi:hypothetical protein
MSALRARDAGAGAPRDEVVITTSSRRAQRADHGDRRERIAFPSRAGTAVAYHTAVSAMAINAFVLPHPGGSLGVVFWDARPSARRSGRPGQANLAGPTASTVEADQLAVYGPGNLSPGEIAELQAHYVASLGGAMREADQTAAVARAQAIWWVGGTIAAIVLAVRALEFGLGYAWLALAAAITALPLGVAAGWPFRSRRAALARRLARRAAALEPVAGTEPRQQERLEALWQMSRRLRGPAGTQLRELERWCREHAWAQAAQLYADRGRQSVGGAPAGGGPGQQRTRTLFGRRAAGDRSPSYSVLEMRAW